MSRRTLLGVWAHPDDEAYTSAGLMADFRRRGDRVVIITATLGEHGTSDPKTWPPGRLAALRHTELRNSLAALDVDELHLLGYQDGHCQREDGTQAIARHIADIDPDVIVTFGPDGMTGHPDHRAISRWTTDAWTTTRPNADLWYATVTADFHRTWGALNDQIGLWADQPDPPCTAAADLALSTRLPDTLLDLKIAALEAHASQTRPLIKLLGPATYRQWWRTESFRKAPPGAPLTSRGDDRRRRPRAHMRQAVEGLGPGRRRRDAVTGHGISDAFRDAELLANALGAVLDGSPDEASATAAYQLERDAHLREIFDITCQLSLFPPAARFTELQKQLADAIEDLAARRVRANAAVDC